MCSSRFGFYYILPTTAPVVLTTPDPTVPVTTLKPVKDACELTIGDYNVYSLNVLWYAQISFLTILSQVENLMPTSSSMPTVATHIGHFLASPDIMFLQEIQDNSGSKDDGTVEANVTLSNLSAAVTKVDNATTYDFVDLAGVNNEDGGQPGGNIRPAHL